MAPFLRAALLALALPAVQAATTPDRFPLESCDGEGGVKATIAGKPLVFAFDTTWPVSYMPGGTGKITEVAVGGKTRVSTALYDIKKDQLPEGADGVLGSPALRMMTLAFDPLAETVEFIGGPKIGQNAAEHYFAALPAWEGGSKVVRLPLARALDGTPLLPARLNGTEIAFAPRLTPLGSILDKTVVRPKEIAGEDDWDYLGGIGLQGLNPGWTAYSAQNDYSQGGHGMLALDVFASRRVTVDLADDAIYVERLSDDARASLFLTRMLSLPIVVQGKALFLGLPPGEEPTNMDAEIPENVEIVSIAKVPSADWLEDLRAGTPASTTRLVRRLADLVKGYDVVTLDAEGNDETFSVPNRERSKGTTPIASLRAVAQARAESRSR